MVTVRELIASTQLPDGNKERLQKVMQQVGYCDSDEVDDILRGLRVEHLGKEAALAQLSPPLTLEERLALLQKAQPAGELVVTVSVFDSKGGPDRWAAPPVAGVLACIRRVLHGRDTALLGLDGSAGISGACHGHHGAACACAPGAPSQKCCRVQSAE